MNTTPVFPGLETIVKPFKFAASPYEYKVTALRECPTPEQLAALRDTRQSRRLLADAHCHAIRILTRIVNVWPCCF